MSHQYTILIGRLGQEPESRKTGNGTEVANLSIATTERWTKDGEKQERTEWHRCTAWGRTAEIAVEFLSKGDLVTVEGTWQTRDWTDKEGVERQSKELTITKLVLMPNGERGTNRQQGERAESPAKSRGQQQPARGNSRREEPPQDTGRRSAPEDLDDDIPF